MNAPAQSAPFDAGDQRRRSLLGMVHVAKKQLELNEDEYRLILITATRKWSAGEMTEGELGDVITAMKERGFVAFRSKRPGPKPADHPVARKARALWISLHQLGAIENPSESALEAFARRQLKCDRLQWANQRLADALIEALKAMAERNGWSQDLAGVKPGVHLLVLKRRLVEAILGRLRGAGWVPGDWPIERAMYEFTGDQVGPLVTSSLSELDAMAQAFGQQLQAAIKAGAVK